METARIQEHKNMNNFGGGGDGDAENRKPNRKSHTKSDLTLNHHFVRVCESLCTVRDVIKSISI